MAVPRRKRKRKPGWYLFILIVCITVLYFFYNTSRNIMEIWRLTGLKRQEEKALARAREKQQTLLMEKERLLSDSTYIEEIARNEYGMIKKGEEIFYISQPDSDETGGKNGKKD